ncbi:MAG: hypothetical protein CMK44_00610 [Porticoccus sp.]|nr:hypothetical protein [Porticoccus sp.]
MILALIVTHNRLSDLKNCIKAVQSQTLKIDKLLIIDNGSTDGTKKYLKDNRIFSIHTENLGSAGGWNKGINYALINNYKYIWMMDDDGFPNIDSLNLLKSNITKDHSCLSSLILDLNNTNTLAIPLPILNKKFNPIIFKFKRKIRKISDLPKTKEFYNYANFFNGALISIKHIKKIGNIDLNFFIYGEEVDFFYRLRNVGKVQTLIKSYHFHPSIEKPWSRIKIYYYLKNSIYLNYKYLDLAFLRSLLNILAIFYRILRLNGILFFFQTFKYGNVKKIISAIYKGFSLKIGNDYYK